MSIRDDIRSDIDNNIDTGKGVLADDHNRILNNLLDFTIGEDNIGEYLDAFSKGIAYIWKDEAARLLDTEILVNESGIQLDTSMVWRYDGPVQSNPDNWTNLGAVDDVPPESAGTVKISSEDTTAGFLGQKLLAGNNITLTKPPTGGNETYVIDAAEVDPESFYFDATVGITGEYLTIALALADGKRILKLISDVTEVGEWNSSKEEVTIFSSKEQRTINVSTSICTIDQLSNVHLHNIKFSVTGTDSIFVSTGVKLYLYGRCDITGDTAINKLSGGVTVPLVQYADDLHINGNTNGCRVSVASAKRVTIIGGSGADTYAVWSNERVEYLSVASGITVLVGGSKIGYVTGGGKLEMRDGVVESGTNVDVFLRTNTTTKNCQLNNLQINDLSLWSSITANSVDLLNNCTIETFTSTVVKYFGIRKAVSCTFNTASNIEVKGDDTLLDNCKVTGILTNSGDNNTFRDCTAGTITNEATADQATFESCTAVTDATDASTTTLKWEINDEIKKEYQDLKVVQSSKVTGDGSDEVVQEWLDGNGNVVGMVDTNGNLDIKEITSLDSRLIINTETYFQDEKGITFSIQDSFSIFGRVFALGGRGDYGLALVGDRAVHVFLDSDQVANFTAYAFSSNDKTRGLDLRSYESGLMCDSIGGAILNAIVASDILVSGNAAQGTSTVNTYEGGDVKISGGTTVVTNGGGAVGGDVKINGGVATSDTGTEVDGDVYIADTTGNLKVGSTNVPTEKLDVEGNIKTTGIFKTGKFTATEASALTAEDADMIYVTSTDATFTSLGFWGYENSVWVKL